MSLELFGRRKNPEKKFSGIFFKHFKINSCSLNVSLELFRHLTNLTKKTFLQQKEISEQIKICSVFDISR